MSREEAKNRSSGVIKLATQVMPSNKPQDGDALSPLVLQNHGSVEDRMPSPKMSEIGQDNLAVPG